MARKRNKRNSDPRQNVGKYTSDSAPAKSKSSGSDATSTSSKDSTKSDDKGYSVEKPNEEQGNMVKGGNARPAYNDPEWYSKDQQLVIDAGSLPFNDPMGDPLKLVDPSTTLYSGDEFAVNVSADVINTSIPGIVTYKSKSTFGNNRTSKDAANVAANALYSHVRYVNSGRKNYDPADLFIYISSVADIYSFIMWCERVYAKAFLYSQRNKYVGDALLRSEFIDPQSIKLNLANFRYWINTYINKVASFAVPAGLSYYQRRAWIYAHLYLENPDANIKDQLYQFTPDGFYRFALDEHGKGMLFYSTIGAITGGKGVPNSPLTFNDFVNIGEWLIANITGDEDFGLMSGDILKAFNGDIIGIPSVPEVVDILPVYSEYVLLQMKNASIMEVARHGSSAGGNLQCFAKAGDGEKCYAGNLYQNTDGNLWSCEAIVPDGELEHIGSGIHAFGRKVLTVKTPVPSPIDVMEISRMVCGADKLINAEASADPDTKKLIQLHCGADIITSMWITSYRHDGVLQPDFYMMDSNVFIDVPNEFDISWVALTEFLRPKFAPLCYICNGRVNDTSLVVDILSLVSDVDNYTVVDNNTLKKLHDVAMYSLLWVPGVAKQVNF